MLIIIPCGGQKLSYRAKARDLYTGPYHKGCQRYALGQVPDTNVLILSALHGLVGLDEEVDPYDLRMGEAGSVSASIVMLQAFQRGVLDEEKVVALGGRSYTSICKAVWPYCLTPLDGIGGIGKQLAWLKRHTHSAKG